MENKEPLKRLEKVRNRLNKVGQIITIDKQLGFQMTQGISAELNECIDELQNIIKDELKRKLKHGTTSH